MSSQNKVIERCHARVGFLGNPSDGFGGKTVSFLIENFYAEVTLSTSSEFQILENPNIDTQHVYSNLASLSAHIHDHGYYGVFRLILATCKVFGDLCISRNLQERVSTGCTISYETTIPRMVGLSGSSAFVVATFRGLLRFYNLSIEDLGVSKAYLPHLILNIEKNELNISAGLQDRVIQVYGGLVHMDFNYQVMAALGTGRYKELPINLLPHLYLAYNYKHGSDSGAVHSTVKERWDRQDKDLVEGMQRLASIADQAVEALTTRDQHLLCALMDENFNIRRSLYGDVVVGPINIAAIEMMNSFDFSAKFSGR
jgi:glucuronokinase